MTAIYRRNADGTLSRDAARVSAEKLIARWKAQASEFGVPKHLRPTFEPLYTQDLLGWPEVSVTWYSETFGIGNK